jgi:uncharacterized protein (DUF1810 family)
MDDPYKLERFVEAQEAIYYPPLTMYEDALRELRAGRKRHHWMWYIFPQVAGLGHSVASQFFAIRSLGEAEAYLAHPLLGPRLEACALAANSREGRSVSAIFGSPDDLKFGSSMTLFAQITPVESVFHTAIRKFFDGRFDLGTLRELKLTKPAR